LWRGCAAAAHGDRDHVAKPGRTSLELLASTKMTTASPYGFHRVGPDEIPQMRGVLSVFAEAFGDHQAYRDDVPRDDYLANLLGNQNFIAIAATLGADVIGGLAAYVLPKFEQERSEIYIYDLAVLERHRRKRVATGLIGALKRIGAGIGAYVIFVQADPPDGPAIALYESLGRRESVLHFDIDVSTIDERSLAATRVRQRD
jgi:aminoglycoside 3-N-acetyltransferase I